MELLQTTVVVTGEGFAPQLVGATTLQDVFPSTPSQVVSTPVLAILEYPDGYQVVVLGERLDVKHLRSAEGVDAPMQAAVLQLMSLWPLVQPKAVGVNFQIGAAYDDDLTQEDLLTRLAPRHNLEETFGNVLVGSVHSYVFREDDVRVTIKVTLDAMIAERAGYMVDINAHYEPVADLQQAVESQAEWYDRAMILAEGLISNPW